MHTKEIQKILSETLSSPVTESEIVSLTEKLDKYLKDELECVKSERQKLIDFFALYSVTLNSSYTHLPVLGHTIKIKDKVAYHKFSIPFREIPHFEFNRSGLNLDEFDNFDKYSLYFTQKIQ